jgi:hypothetical protein
MTELPAGIDTGALAVTPGTTDVSGQLSTAGLAFGDLVKLVGQAVADTQQKLNQTAAASTSALAQTLVDMIAVQEVDFDDSGQVTGSKTFTQKLPLINFVDPVLYQWTSVNLQGRFAASQFARADSLSATSGSITDESGQAGFGIIFGLGYNNFQYDNSQVDVSTASSVESSVGLMRMTAVLEPRHDIGVPLPRTAIQGPTLDIAAGPIVEHPASGGTPATRTMDATITMLRPDATPVEDALISVSTDGVPWTFTTAGSTTTDVNGQLGITLTRTFLDPTADTSPVPVVVSARIGIVSASATLTF